MHYTFNEHKPFFINCLWHSWKRKIHTRPSNFFFLFSKKKKIIFCALLSTIYQLYIVSTQCIFEGFRYLFCFLRFIHNQNDITYAENMIFVKITKNSFLAFKISFWSSKSDFSKMMFRSPQDLSLTIQSQKAIINGKTT